MDTLASMRLFRQVAEGGSFARAARLAGISAAMASKHVAHLEKTLGTRLFNRTSRHVSLTEAGQVYFEQCCEALDLLEQAEAALQNSHAEPRGVLKLTAPVWCADARFAGLLAAYRARYPQVVLDVRLSNHKVDLAAEGLDLALRATSQNLPSLIVRPLGQIRFVLVAAPAYLARAGAIATPDDLPRHPAVLPSYLKAPHDIALNGPDGALSRRVPAALLCDDSNLVHHSILAGIGPGYLPAWTVEDDIAHGRLARVLPDYDGPVVTLYAAYTSRRFLAPKVRTFIDFLAAAFD